jgi:hypothetical protein
MGASMQDDEARRQISALKDLAKQTNDNILIGKKAGVDINDLRDMYTYYQQQIAEVLGSVVKDNACKDNKVCVEQCSAIHCVVYLQVGSREPIKEVVSAEHSPLIMNGQQQRLEHSKIIELLLQTSSCRWAAGEKFARGHLHDVLTESQSSLKIETKKLLPDAKSRPEYDKNWVDFVTKMLNEFGDSLTNITVTTNDDTATWTLYTHVPGKYLISHSTIILEYDTQKIHTVIPKFYCVQSGYPRNDDVKLAKLHARMLYMSKESLFDNAEFNTTGALAYIFKYNMFTIVLSNLFNSEKNQSLLSCSVIQWISSPKRKGNARPTAQRSQELENVKQDVQILERKIREIHVNPQATSYKMFVPSIFNNGKWGYYEADNLDYNKQKHISICLHRYAGQIIRKFFVDVSKEHADMKEKAKETKAKVPKFFTFLKNKLVEQGKYIEEDKHFPGIFGKYLEISGNTAAAEEWKKYWDVHFATYEIKAVLHEQYDQKKDELVEFFKSSQTKLHAECIVRQPAIGNKLRHLLSEAKSDKHHKPLMNEIDALKRHINKLSLRLEAK